MTADPLTFFRLKQIKAARVSEISEATSAASIPKDEQINFHIGNPLQDPSLVSAYLRIALGIDGERQVFSEESPEEIIEYLGWTISDKPKLDLLIRVLKNSIPYMPRGGYSRKSPHFLIRKLCSWLEHQQEPLFYDLGDESGKREIILCSGGITETLRVILHAISENLMTLPARILCYQVEISTPEIYSPNLHFLRIHDDERIAGDEIEQLVIQQPNLPTFLIIGRLINEDMRRRLRLLATESALFFVEANNAPNHLSLAREAKLIHRVIRLLTPGIFANRLDQLSTIFVLGNVDFLRAIETVHFKIKGTPSAAEVELLSFLLEQFTVADNKENRFESAENEILNEEPERYGKPGSTLNDIANRIGTRLGQRVNENFSHLEHYITPLDAKLLKISKIMGDRYKGVRIDEFADLDCLELIEQLLTNHQDIDWCETLKKGFLIAFLKHQPQYQLEACTITSGSSRTALGILGFHCGITDVVIPDLSWSYEQCFPNVHVIPLTIDFELDVDATINKIEQLCQDDLNWPNHGALVFNNPHNATGRVFSEDSVRKMVKYCINHNITMIDDLAYQYVAPVEGLPVIKTIRQIANDLVIAGAVNGFAQDRLITVHSMSKTDCLAGARLAVVEIRDEHLRQRFFRINNQIRPNLAAIFMSYLFYRNPSQGVRSFWSLRNKLFKERSQALISASENLPPNRNPFDITIIPPAGSMYPLLQIKKLPAGLSLDWLASNLARRGVGLLPLTTFARTEEGFEIGRSSFRLTLGGSDPADILLVKTRRLLIDLNRIIAEENSRYNLKGLKIKNPVRLEFNASEKIIQWENIVHQLLQRSVKNGVFTKWSKYPTIDGMNLETIYIKEYLPERLEIFKQRLLDRALVIDELMNRSSSDGGRWLSLRLEREFMKDSLKRRQELFLNRNYDRTVHPTQRYSLQVENAIDAIQRKLISHEPVLSSLIDNASRELINEFLGLNVSINSQNEANEILLDFNSLIYAEEYTDSFCDSSLTPFLSFWSDWDGSNRPSGQGHTLIASLVMENVQQMAAILSLLKRIDPQAAINSELLEEIDALPQKSKHFYGLLNNITDLTNQLEQRYRGILPYSTDTSRFRQFTTRMHLRRDPIKVLWEHNDRYEQKMRDLRQQRRVMLETYFSLNKKLRKQLFALIPTINENINDVRLLKKVVEFRDLLQRCVITPRIHQGMVVGRDPFAIDTTVSNIHELNRLAGKYGNPGMVLGLQISMSTRPEALISLDRKITVQAEQMRREGQDVDLPSIWLIPLFEDIDIVRNIPTYLDRVWDYSTQSRRTNQSVKDRFEEIVSELFIAGSDLSQQISQAHGAFQYQKAKYDLQTWLAEHGVVKAVRIKLGSGEAMQRQGGYYSEAAGQPAFPQFWKHQMHFSKHLPEAAQKSTEYAVTPLQGIFSGGDLRTFQSCISEQLRYIPVSKLANTLHHVRESQVKHLSDLVRAKETIAESRLGRQRHSVQELERLTIGRIDPIYEGFLDELTRHFRQILYGQKEDVVGIHIISYFIARSMPQLRDRPTSRNRPAAGVERGQQILANIAELIPLAEHGSLLRAIAHNQAQTSVLGINQLTTGLFRALEYYSQKTFTEADSDSIIVDRILPNLPVYEILQNLRIYQDIQGKYIQLIEPAFPAGNTAFVALREDIDAMQKYLPLLQQELIRRHGLNVGDFLENGTFIQALLPTLRPDLAVLLQNNLFNTSTDQLTANFTNNLETGWIEKVQSLLNLPIQIQYWRSIIWDLIGESIFARVQSFTELASALYRFSSTGSPPVQQAMTHLPKLSSQLNEFIRSAPVEDEMRQFLVGAVNYLNSFSEGSVEVPVTIIRALNDVNRLAIIEENPLSPEKNQALRFAGLQIARLSGDNG